MNKNVGMRKAKKSITPGKVLTRVLITLAAFGKLVKENTSKVIAIGMIIDRCSFNPSNLDIPSVRINCSKETFAQKVMNL